MVFGMGFGTNATAIPTLIGKGGLIISDSTNHSSIAVGCRSSGATIKVFRHNDIEHMEAVIRRAIIEGQPRTRRPWTKIMIVVEGIYSMEGEMCPLKEIVEIKNKYKVRVQIFCLLFHAHFFSGSCSATCLSMRLTRSAPSARTAAVSASTPACTQIRSMC